MWRTRPPTEPLVVTRFPIASFEGPISAGRNRIAVSRDGTRLVYYVNGRPLLRDTSQFAAKPIPSSFTGQTVFSPDGRTLAAWSADNTIKRIDIGGGAVETVCPADNVFGMMTWDTDALIVGEGPNGIVRCRLSGGAPQQIVKLEAGEEADDPQMLPGGGAVLFTLARSEDGAARWENARIVIQSLTSNERSLVLERANSGQYLATGHLVYARGGVVFAAPFDVQRKQVIGQGTAVIEGVRRAPGAATAGAQFAISNNGHLFYIPGPAGTGVPRPQHRHRRSRGKGDAAPHSPRRIRAHACLSGRQVAGGGHGRRQGCGGLDVRHRGKRCPAKARPRRSQQVSNLVTGRNATGVPIRSRRRSWDLRATGGWDRPS